jgi:dTDP-4-amino-4,6-dideoxygalactose transaminase
MTKLAIHGGVPIRRKPYPPFITTGEEEVQVAAEVMRRGILSDFEGSNNEYFLGGKEVQSFEKEWAEYFGVRHAISVNSATSGLMAAVGAAGVGPGDEVITTPWTMTATATAIVVNNAVPIFADITDDTLSLSPAAVEKRITPRTKAIIPVHIYGHPAEMDELNALAKVHGLVVIEDAAQSPGIRYNGRYTGTIGDMGIFSLNCHKIIQTGEGGVIVTDNDEFAQRLRLIRNHAEAVVATGMPVSTLVNMVGWNYRMNEVEAAVGRVQLKKLKPLLAHRRELVERFFKGVNGLQGLRLPTIKNGSEHSFYRLMLQIDPTILGVDAPVLVEVLNKEGMDFYAGHLPINLFPMYQQQIAFGDRGCPFRCPWYEGKPDYSMDALPTVQRMRKVSFTTEVITHCIRESDIDEMIAAFQKVWANLAQVRAYATRCQV